MKCGSKWWLFKDALSLIKKLKSHLFAKFTFFRDLESGRKANDFINYKENDDISNANLSKIYQGWIQPYLS